MKSPRSVATSSSVSLRGYVPMSDIDVFLSSPCFDYSRVTLHDLRESFSICHGCKLKTIVRTAPAYGQVVSRRETNATNNVMR
jgi:hypothetical protein